MSARFQLSQLLEKRRIQRRLFRNMPSSIRESDARKDWQLNAIAVFAVTILLGMCVEQIYARCFADPGIVLRMADSIQGGKNDGR